MKGTWSVEAFLMVGIGFNILSRVQMTKQCPRGNTEGIFSVSPREGGLPNLALGWSHVSSNGNFVRQGPWEQLLMGYGVESGLSRVRMAFFFSYEFFSVNRRSPRRFSEL